MNTTFTRKDRYAEREWIDHLGERNTRAARSTLGRDLQPARGILNGLLLGALSWAAIILAVIFWP